MKGFPCLSHCSVYYNFLNNHWEPQIHMKSFSSSTLEKLEYLVYEFRNDIISGKISFIGSEDFPIGCCGNASERLYTILKREGFTSVKLISNMWHEGQSHSWIEFHDVIIDITIDQFDGFDSKDVFISKEDSCFHKLFERL